nr:DMT family transporter [uncultured Mogibacterium sp.]
MDTKRRNRAMILLFTVISLRATSLLFATTGLSYMGPLTLNGYRFPLASIILLFIFRKDFKNVNRQVVIHGSIIGFFFLLTMTTELIGLKMTNSSTTSFLENTAIIFVPLMDAILIRKIPKPPVIISALVALAGVGFLTLKDGHIGLSLGEFICLLSALAYTCAVVATDRFSKQDDPFMLGIIQVAFIGISSFVVAMIAEGASFPTAPKAWGVIIFLAIVCTCFGFTLQPVAQSKLSAAISGLFCAFNPLITAILGYIFLNERLGTTGLIGGALILISIIIPAIAPMIAPIIKKPSTGN